MDEVIATLRWRLDLRRGGGAPIVGAEAVSCAAGQELGGQPKSPEAASNYSMQRLWPRAEFSSSENVEELPLHKMSPTPPCVGEICQTRSDCGHASRAWRGGRRKRARRTTGAPCSRRVRCAASGRGGFTGGPQLGRVECQRSLMSLAARMRWRHVTVAHAVELLVHLDGPPTNSGVISTF